MLINRGAGGFVTALARGGKLIELIHDPFDRQSLVENIYAGIVKNINAGFIFVDIGLDKHAFLDSRDSREAALLADGKLTVKQGDALIVQVLKDGFGGKGPLATTSLSAAGRYFVLTKSDRNGMTFSRKLDEAARNRLKPAAAHIPPGFSAIVRSEAEERSIDECIAEFPRLLSQFDAQEKWQYAKPPAALVVRPAILKTLQEIAGADIDEILVDCPDTFALLKAEFCPLFPDFAPKLRFYDQNEPIFAHFFLQTQIPKIREKKVWLNSGAFIVIEQTEACVTIDVNSGKHSGRGNADNIKLKINMEAAREAAFQLRLRNLAGIIIIDFLHMHSRENITALTQFLSGELARDRIPAVCVGMTALGLMEVTRKRSR